MEEYVLIEPLPELTCMERLPGFLDREYGSLSKHDFVRVRYGIGDAGSPDYGEPRRNTNLLFVRRDRYAEKRADIASAFAMSVVVALGTNALHLYGLLDEGVAGALRYLTEKYYLIIPCAIGESEETPLPCGGVYRTRESLGEDAYFSINMGKFTGLVDIFVAGEAVSLGDTTSWLRNMSHMRKAYLNPMVLHPEKMLYIGYGPRSLTEKFYDMVKNVDRQHALAAEEVF